MGDKNVKCISRLKAEPHLSGQPVCIEQHILRKFKMTQFLVLMQHGS